MEQFKKMNLDKALQYKIDDAKKAKEYEQKKQDWMNSERME